MKTIVVMAALALVAILGDICLHLRPLEPATTVSVAQKPATVEAAPVVAAPAPTVRAQVQQAIAQARPQLQTPREVVRYLDDLKVQARRNHQVTALEVLPGVEAIRESDPEHAKERVREFQVEMAELSAELRR